MSDTQSHVITKAPVKGWWNLVLRRIVLFYVLFAFPMIVIYGGVLWFTDLSGRRLLYSVFPVGGILLANYVLCLIKPAWRARFQITRSSKPLHNRS